MCLWVSKKKKMWIFFHPSHWRKESEPNPLNRGTDPWIRTAPTCHCKKVLSFSCLVILELPEEEQDPGTVSRVTVGLDSFQVLQAGQRQHLVQLPKDEIKLIQCCGSGLRCLFYPRPGSGSINIAEKQYISINPLVTKGYFCTRQLCRFFSAAYWLVLQRFWVRTDQ